MMTETYQFDSPDAEKNVQNTQVGSKEEEEEQTYHQGKTFCAICALTFLEQHSASSSVVDGIAHCGWCQDDAGVFFSD